MELRRYKKGDCIVYNSKNENYILSNMYCCKLRVDNMVFGGVDCYYYWRLARLVGDEKIEKDIINCKGVCACFEAKRLFQKKYKDFENEVDIKLRFKFIKEGIRLKASQCDEFRNLLINSGNKDLVEFAPWGDTLWGCVLKGDEYVGVNACGRLMMSVREEINKKNNN